ncbi:MAG: UDP-N-acetylmuramate--L-alanine ligase [Bacteroidota bacterium]|nr:UDP-N-acetylmuramate--L-alanine ligase [Bacteroidota bacterium]
MNMLAGHKLFFIGIGGIGMSGLARYFSRKGARVAGYDRTPSELTNQLQSEGIDVQFNESVALIPEDFTTAKPGDVIVIRTPAVPVSSAIFTYWQQRGARILKRAELLGMVTSDQLTIAVAGTHGKTTVSTMLAHLLTVGKIKINAFLGGISTNYGTNVLLNGEAEVNVVEADEYDRSFLKLHPKEAIITAMDPDHLDIYGTPEAMDAAYAEFASLVKGTLFVHKAIEGKFKEKKNVVTYSLDGTGIPRAENLRIENGDHIFDLITEGAEMRDLKLGMSGRHNVENAIVASALAMKMGVSQDLLREGLRSFRGVTRRFEKRINRNDVVFIDDYAHHPRELDALIGSVRELYPGKRITGVFQPHLFSRTRDHAAEFAKSLSQLDELILLEIYPAREDPIPGISSTWLLDQVPMESKELCRKEDLVAELRSRDLQVLVTIGAGDIDREVPAIERMLNERSS